MTATASLVLTVDSGKAPILVGCTAEAAAAALVGCAAVAAVKFQILTEDLDASVFLDGFFEIFFKTPGKAEPCKAGRGQIRQSQT